MRIFSCSEQSWDGVGDGGADRVMGGGGVNSGVPSLILDVVVVAW